MTEFLCLMPNIGGPRTSKVRTLVSVIYSQVLYAAPLWCGAVKSQVLGKLRRLQRTMCIRVNSAYRSISRDATNIPLIEPIVRERKELCNGKDEATGTEEEMQEWQLNWTRGTYGRWTYQLIPDIQS
ncbi:hypothetical protein Trydic_g4449 [Trypoxylus dichotomus]